MKESGIPQAESPTNKEIRGQFAGVDVAGVRKVERLCAKFDSLSFSQLEASGKRKIELPGSGTCNAWSMTLQRELGTGWALIAGYTGSRALHLWEQAEPNVNRWVGWPNNVPTGQKVFPARTSPLFSGRINPTFSEIRYQYPNANSYHNDLAVGLQKRLNQGFVMQASYTLSKTVDDGSGVTSTSGRSHIPVLQRGRSRLRCGTRSNTAHRR
jgi:hypothetical protein